MTTQHQPLPVQGYKPQSQATIDLVNENKALEEMVLRQLDKLGKMVAANPAEINGRWLSIGRTHLEQAFMAINRALFQPQRIKLPSDSP